MPRMKTLGLVGAFLFFSALPCFGQQRPLLTDDADTAPSGSIELSAGAEFLQNAKFPLSGLKGDLSRIAVMRLKTGVGRNVEISVDGAVRQYLSIDSRSVPSPIPLSFSGDSTSDFDDFSTAVKVRMRNESKRAPAIATKFGFQMPNTNQARGIGTNQINVFSKVILQKTFGARKDKEPAAKVFGNIGLGIMNSPLGNFSQNDVVLYGLAGFFRASDRVSIGSEVNGRLNTRRPTAPLGTESVGQFRLGTRIKASQRVSFDAAFVAGTTAFSPKTGVVFGVTYLSPRIFPEVD